jgi:UDP-N-acetylglucosamine:LPS N-acetylglucosamine transferase
LIRDHIQSKKVDIVISLIPFVNYPASKAARQCDVHFLIITTDNDLTNWVFNLEKIDTSKFKLTYGFDLETTKELLARKGIPESAIEQLGLPLRPEFIDTEDKTTLRAKYEIPERKNVVLIMMGGAGSRLIVKYVKALVGSSMNLHVLVCSGRSRHLARKLKSLTPAMGNTLDVIPFTEKVHELLALSDLLLTKPGPGSINEAYALKLPILLDHTKPPLFWEKANIDLVMRDGVGACIDQIKDAPDLVARFLFDEQTREKVLRAYEAVPENRFATAITELIGEMLEAPATDEVVVSGRNVSRLT